MKAFYKWTWQIARTLSNACIPFSMHCYYCNIILIIIICIKCVQRQQMINDDDLLMRNLNQQQLSTRVINYLLSLIHLSGRQIAL